MSDTEKAKELQEEAIEILNRYMTTEESYKVVDLIIAATLLYIARLIKEGLDSG